MPANIAYIYWDACVFLDYFNAHPDRVKTLDDILAEIANDSRRKIITSVLSQAEVAYVHSEKIGKATTPEIEKRIDAFWGDDNIIELVDLHSIIATNARKYIRQTIPEGLALKASDAVHLATAKWVQVQEFHTYDSLEKFAPITGLKICQPYPTHPRLL